MDRTNYYLTLIWCLWATNTVDIPVTPSGDEYLRQHIVQEIHVYKLRTDSAVVTNVVVVATNTVRRKMVWVETPVQNSPESRVRSPESARRVPDSGLGTRHSELLVPGGKDGFPPVPTLPPAPVPIYEAEPRP